MKNNDLVIWGILAAGLFYIYEQSKKQLPLPPAGGTMPLNTSLAAVTPGLQSVAAGYSLLPGGSSPIKVADPTYATDGWLVPTAPAISVNPSNFL